MKTPTNADIAFALCALLLTLALFACKMRAKEPLSNFNNNTFYNARLEGKQTWHSNTHTWHDWVEVEQGFFKCSGCNKSYIVQVERKQPKKKHKHIWAHEHSGVVVDDMIPLVCIKCYKRTKKHLPVFEYNIPVTDYRGDTLPVLPAHPIFPRDIKTTATP